MIDKITYLDIMLSIPLHHDSPHAGHSNHRQDVKQVQAGGHGQDDEPEPKSNVNLLVDDIQGQNAHDVMTLDRTRRTVLVEVALGNPRKKRSFSYLRSSCKKINEYLGNTLIIGSVLCSGSISFQYKTSVP